MLLRACLSIQSITFKKASKDVESVSNINKTKHPTKGEKIYIRWKDPCLGKQFFFPKGVNLKGIWTSQVPTPPPWQIVRNIYNKERGRTLEKTYNLEEPSPIVISCFEIKTTCTCCNTINMFYL
jgi:hypothetical protein